MTRFALALALVLLGPLAFAADPVVYTPKPVTVSAAAAPTPALKYLLLPDLTEVHDGNQVQLFMKVFAEQNTFFFGKDEQEKREKYLAMPFDELPNDLRDYGGKVIDRMHDAARGGQVDWQILRDLRKDGTNTLLPDVQWMRMLASVLKVRCRGEIKAGDFPAAIRTVQTMLALARSFNDHPTLIGQLVGCAIAAIGLGCVEEMVQRPGCPNLYWALSDLPTPLIDLDKGLKGERVMFAAEFSDFPRGGAKWTDDQQGKAFQRLPKLFPALEAAPPNVKKPEDFPPFVAGLSTDDEFLKVAAGWLTEAGYTAADVQNMTPIQRVIVGSVERAYQLNDETAKWMRRPYHEIPDAVKEFGDGDKLKAEKMNFRANGVFAGYRAWMLKPKLAQTRTDSLVAQLRMVEALRMAAAKGGKFPATLPADTPTPTDPFSGKPLVHAVKAEKAEFTLTPPLGLENAKPYNTRWEITLRAK